MAASDNRLWITNNGFWWRLVFLDNGLIVFGVGFGGLALKVIVYL
jgi:hypothetical protein